MEAEVVELLVAGTRVEIPRGAGFELFEHHCVLLAEGRIETAVLALSGSPSAALHLVLGAGSMALLDSPAPGADAPAAAAVPDLDTADLFLDFDAYAR